LEEKIEAEKKANEEGRRKLLKSETISRGPQGSGRWGLAITEEFSDELEITKRGSDKKKGGGEPERPHKVYRVGNASTQEVVKPRVGRRPFTYTSTDRWDWAVEP